VYKDGVPLLKDHEIEAYGYEFVRKYSPISIKRNLSIPIIEILKIMVAKKMINFDIVDLGTDGDYKVLGKTILDKNTILIDESLYYNTEKNFILRRTIAHELGHWTFHRRKKIKFISEKEQELEENDFVYRLVNGEELKVYIKDIDFFKDFKKVLKNPVDFAEHQAKIFAASVLLPKDILINVLIDYQKNIINMTKNFGYIYINDVYSSILEFYDTLKYLKKYFEVSKASIEYRLTYLNRIIDTRTKSRYTAKNLSHILNEI